jgi:adenylyl-sulfate kinase
LSGSGKTTIANELKNHLKKCVVLDGDILRNGINQDLGFSVKDRNENIRRTAYIAKLLYDLGHNVIVAFISPIKQQREFARSLFDKDDFIEVYISTSLKECQKRDVKGLYKKVENGQIMEFTGITSPYQPPDEAEITIDTTVISVIESVDMILEF